MTTTDETATDTRPKLGASYYKLLIASAISNAGDGVALVAYPWLASAITRNGFLIALVAVAQFLPWLFFSLIAGVITDRYDRRTLMVSMNVARTVLTLFVAFAVLGSQSDLPLASEIADGVSYDSPLLYLMLLGSSLLLGMAQVLYDNTAQTIMPSLVSVEQLPKANGRLWGVEQTANNFVGPFFGALLLSVAFSVPFFFDAGTFAVSAALIALLPKKAVVSAVKEHAPWKDELKEGVRWLWNHELLRPLAIILGLLNGLMEMTLATFVLYAQDVLEIDEKQFGIIIAAGAAAAIIGAMLAANVTEKVGPGPTLWLTLIVAAGTSLVIGTTSNWIVVWFMFFIVTLFGVFWNVLTVSLRQEIIPDHLLGRVNSVYRFFAWGMIPIGGVIGGLTVFIWDRFGSHDTALRAPWIISSVGSVFLLIYAAPKLTTAKIEAAQAEAAARKASET